MLTNPPKSLIKPLLLLSLTTVVAFSNCRNRTSDHVMLRIWQTETDKGAVQQLNETIAEFKRQNPGVEVQLESVGWSSLASKLAVALQAHNEPDLTHLEPFMVGSLRNRDLLMPLDDIISKIETENNDQILPSVRNLQVYDGVTYGMAYAVGTTGWAYRKDEADRLGLREPQTWDEYVAFVKRMHEESHGKLGVLLPGGDPFFIDQLFVELVVNNGGSLFDTSTNRPRLISREVVETLAFFRKLGPYIDSGWQTQSYLDQFNRFARGEAGSVPVSYARAAKAIETTLGSTPSSNLKPTPEYFAWMPQPGGPSRTGPPIATIDCEPYVIFKSAETRSAGTYGSNADLAKKFLLLFYKKEYYLPFVKQVPIHLTPIFKGMSESDEYLSSPMVNGWGQWERQTRGFLSQPGRTRPILMTDDSEAFRRLPFLLDFQLSRILTQAVAEVLSSPASSGTPEQVAQTVAETAQKRAEQLVESLGFKRWSGN